MASRPSRFLKGPVAVTCTIALASALSLPPVALAASDGSSSGVDQARITLQSNGRMLKFDQALINQVGLQNTGGSDIRSIIVTVNVTAISNARFVMGVWS